MDIAGAWLADAVGAAGGCGVYSSQAFVDAMGDHGFFTMLAAAMCLADGDLLRVHVEAPLPVQSGVAAAAAATVARLSSRATAAPTTAVALPSTRVPLRPSTPPLELSVGMSSPHTLPLDGDEAVIPSLSLPVEAQPGWVAGAGATEVGARPAPSARPTTEAASPRQRRRRAIGAGATRGRHSRKSGIPRLSRQTPSTGGRSSGTPPTTSPRSLHASVARRSPRSVHGAAPTSAIPRPQASGGGAPRRRRATTSALRITVKRGDVAHVGPAVPVTPVVPVPAAKTSPTAPTAPAAPAALAVNAAAAMDGTDGAAAAAARRAPAPPVPAADRPRRVSALSVSTAGRNRVHRRSRVLSPPGSSSTWGPTTIVDDFASARRPVLKGGGKSSPRAQSKSPRKSQRAAKTSSAAAGAPVSAPAPPAVNGVGADGGSKRAKRGPKPMALSVKLSLRNLEAVSSPVVPVPAPAPAALPLDAAGRSGRKRSPRSAPHRRQQVAAAAARRLALASPIDNADQAVQTPSSNGKGKEPGSSGKRTVRRPPLRHKPSRSRPAGVGATSRSSPSAMAPVSPSPDTCRVVLKLPASAASPKKPLGGDLGTRSASAATLKRSKSKKKNSKLRRERSVAHVLTDAAQPAGAGAGTGGRVAVARPVNRAVAGRRHHNK